MSLPRASGLAVKSPNGKAASTEATIPPRCDWFLAPPNDISLFNKSANCTSTAPFLSIILGAVPNIPLGNFFCPCLSAIRPIAPPINGSAIDSGPGSSSSSAATLAPYPISASPASLWPKVPCTGESRTLAASPLALDVTLRLPLAGIVPLIVFSAPFPPKRANKRLIGEVTSSTSPAAVDPTRGIFRRPVKTPAPNPMSWAIPSPPLRKVPNPNPLVSAVGIVRDGEGLP